MKKKKAMKFIVPLLVVLLVFIVGRNFLIVDEKPKKADVVIALSGDKGRLQKAVSLYKEGYAEYVMLSRANDPWLTEKEAIELGIPENRLILEKNATSTYTNAIYAKSEMEKLQLDSAIVVSSDYHMKRIEFTFDDVFEGSDIELTYVASKRSENPWYLDFKNIRRSFLEFFKIAGYKLKLYEFIDMD